MVRYTSLVRHPYLSDIVILSLQRFNRICSCFVSGVRITYIGLGYLLTKKKLYFKPQKINCYAQYFMSIWCFGSHQLLVFLFTVESCTAQVQPRLVQ